MRDVDRASMIVALTYEETAHCELKMAGVLYPLGKRILTILASSTSSSSAPHKTVYKGKGMQITKFVETSVKLWNLEYHPMK